MRIENDIDLDLTKLLAPMLEAVEAAAEVVADAALKVTPDDPATVGNDLKGSQKVTAEATADGARAAISYSGRHAIPQHQRMDYRRRPGQQSKYLEGPLHQNAGPALEAAAAEMRRRLGE